MNKYRIINYMKKHQIKSIVYISLILTVFLAFFIFLGFINIAIPLILILVLIVLTFIVAIAIAIVLSLTDN